MLAYDNRLVVEKPREGTMDHRYHDAIVSMFAGAGAGAGDQRERVSLGAPSG